MNVIPQRVRDGFGKLIEPLAVVFIRLHIRPNLITTVGTLVVIASATAFGLGWVRSGGLLLLVSGVFDLLDGRVARRADMTTTFGAFYDSTLDRVGEAALFGGIALYFLRGGVPPERLTFAVVACLVALAASLIVSYTRARAEGGSEEHTSELQSRLHPVCRLLLEKKKSPPAAASPAWGCTAEGVASGPPAGTPASAGGRTPPRSSPAKTSTLVADLYMATDAQTPT